MESFVFSLNATVPVFAVIFISYWLKRKGFFSSDFVGGLDRFSFRVLLPLLLFRDIATSRMDAVFQADFFVLCFLITAVMILGIWAGARLFLADKRMVGTFTQASYRSSIAILGIAFAQNIYGSAGLVPLMIVAVVPLYNIAAVVVLVLSAAEPMAGRSMVRSCTKGIFTNPIILSIFAGIPFSVWQITFPAIMAKTIDNFANMAAPLALVVIGAGFEGNQALQKLRPAIAASIIKLLVLPMVFLPLAYALGYRGEAMVALLIMLGSPTTVTAYIMAKNMGGDGALSSSVIVLTTVASAVTLTGFLCILRAVGAI